MNIKRKEGLIMKIFKLGYSARYAKYNVRNKIDYSFIQNMKKDKSLIDTWDILELEQTEAIENAQIGYILTFLNSVILVNESVKSLIESEFEARRQEFLEARNGEEIVYIMHNIEPYLIDMEVNCEGEEIVYSFNKEQLEKLNINEKGIFKVKLENGFISPLFCTEKFVEYMKSKNKLTIGVELVWEG